jgi:hypothetical protein
LYIIVSIFDTKNDLDPAIRQEAIELLNDRLADCIDLHAQVKRAHWNVKGPRKPPATAMRPINRRIVGRFLRRWIMATPNASRQARRSEANLPPDITDIIAVRLIAVDLVGQRQATSFDGERGIADRPAGPVEANEGLVGILESIAIVETVQG